MAFLKAILPIVLAILCAVPALADSKDARAEALYKQLQGLITEFYPNATFEIKGGRFSGKYNTRTFMIHHALKTGEWQDAFAQEGPNKGGILCTIESSTGKYGGAAMVPQTFDYRYFSSLLMAPENSKSNTYLIAHLNYPSSVSVEFINRYRDLIESYSDREKKRSSH
jgi:hypothetical protein